MTKTVLFSYYINEGSIITNPSAVTKDSTHRYSIRIPFKNRKEKNAINAIVIMKNPSAAGKKVKINNKTRIISDDTIYTVLDYLYKQKQYYVKEVITVNLMSIYSGTLSNIIKTSNSIEDLSAEANLKEIQQIVEISNESDIIIAAWGGYPSYSLQDTKPYQISNEELKRYYDSLIENTQSLIKGRNVFRVRSLTKDGFPRHGKNWYDYEKLRPYQV
nr:DUF1643 domain-containing protein [Heyndrickxia oleronia]